MLALPSPGWPLLYEAEGAALGVQWPRGLLLHGPPGCGKSALVKVIADEFGIKVHNVSAADIYGAYTGVTQKGLSLQLLSTVASEACCLFHQQASRRDT